MVPDADAPTSQPAASRPRIACGQYRCHRSVVKWDLGPTRDAGVLPAVANPPPSLAVRPFLVNRLGSRARTRCRWDLTNDCHTTGTRAVPGLTNFPSGAFA